MRKLVFLFVLFATFGVVARAADVTFKASAPEAVVMGETFRLSYTVNAEGRDIRVPEIPDFEVLIGPSTSTNMSTQIINGKMTTGNVIDVHLYPPTEERGYFQYRTGNNQGQRRQLHI